jgi:hypothetical protein
MLVAADLERLPRFGLEEINIGSVVDCQQKLDAIAGQLASEIE